jgi:chromosome segregation ATPase
MNANTSKRQRLTQLGDVTHISDSVQGSQLEQVLREAQQNLVDTKLENAKRTSQMQTSISNAQKQLQEHAKLISQLQSEKTTAEARLQDFIAAHGKLQFRYESKCSELLKTRQERDTAIERITSAETKRDHTIKENTKLKEERLQFQADLQSARDDLKTAGGTVAEMETLREEIRKLNKENASLEKRHDSVQNELSYIRDAFQNGATTAVEQAGQISHLELENTDLRKRADSTAAHFKTLSLNHEKDQHLSKIAELETALASRDELLRRKEEEVRELRKGRGMGTRASSVQPRSPRLGNSRPVSPAPGNMVPIQILNPRGGSGLRFGHEIR